MTDQKPKLSQRELHFAELYATLEDRYKALPDALAWTLIGTRLLALRHGLNSVMRTLQTQGIDYVAQHTRNEIENRNAFIVGTAEKYPDTLEEGELEKLKGETEQVTTLINGPQFAERLYGFLYRLLAREMLLRPPPKPKMPKPDFDPSYRPPRRKDTFH